MFASRSDADDGCLGMWLIAVDEAGYGPKLGPLVVGATLWQSEPASDSESLAEQFAPLQTPVLVGTVSIRVDDSKRVFRSRSQRSSTESTHPLDTVHHIVSTACHASELGVVAEESMPSVIDRIIGPKPRSTQSCLSDVSATPWLVSMLDGDSYPSELPPRLISRELCGHAIDHWGQSPWKLRSISAAMITAERFNAFVEGDKDRPSRGNKSDLLSETSLRLAREIADQIPAEDQASVEYYFDRQGGRRYYAGVVQQFLTDAPVQVVEEASSRSVYEVCDETLSKIHFTVKGDRFPPVAMSSLVAKYLREVAMESFNDFFSKRWQGHRSVFRPTAGYPVDADRFLKSVQAIRKQERIDDRRLIRCR